MPKQKNFTKEFETKAVGLLRWIGRRRDQAMDAPITAVNIVLLTTIA